MQSQLDDKLGDTQRENDVLVKNIQGQEEEMEQILQGLETAVANLDSINRELQENVEDGEIRKEAKELDAEMAGQRNGKESRL